MTIMTITKISILSFSVLLASCAVTSNSNSVKQIREVTLQDGTLTRIGFTPVEKEWNCKMLAQNTSNAAMNKLKGVFKMNGRFEVMEQNAIDYANETHLQPNYIYLYIPTEVVAGALDTSMFSNAQTTYYQCKTPPAVNDDIKSLVN
jgi:hypothetical protein